MVIGNGMLANAFKPYIDNSEIIIFASGVSNSKELCESNFKKEKELLKQTITYNPKKTIVYFSTCSIEDGSVNHSRYITHKIEMEEIIEKICDKFYIFRLPQVVGKTKSNTLVKFLFESILTGKKMLINKNSTRNIINVNDVFRIASYCINNEIYINEITNIATSNNVFVVELVHYIEKITSCKAFYDLIDFGEPQNIDISAIKALFNQADILEKEYTFNVLKEYFDEIKE